MNIHTLNDLGGNNNNNINNDNNNVSNNNDNNQNNQFFLAGMNPDNPNESFLEFLFPKNICKLKTISFLLICSLTIVYIIQLIIYYSLFKPNGYRWSCLLYRFGALELSSITNYYQFFRLITSMITHNNFLHLFSNCLSIAFIGFYA